MRSIRIYNCASVIHLSRKKYLIAMIVCVCNRVSDREIARRARAGMSFDDIQFELGVATQCGQCESCARAIVAQCSSSSPVAAIQLAPRIQESAAWNSSSVSASA